MKGGWVGVPFSGVTCVEGQIEAKWSSSVARTLVPQSETACLHCCEMKKVV